MMLASNFDGLPETLYLHLGIVALIAGIFVAGFIVSLILTRGKRRNLGVCLAMVFAMLLVLQAVFVLYFFSH